MMAWLYEPDEQPKRKHYWAEDVAGFEEDGAGQFVGKCPSRLSMQEARQLLDSAFPWSPQSWTRAYPKRLFAVKDGVLYRATPTNPGVSYHGFPEPPSAFPKGAGHLKDLLLRRAQSLGSEAELRRRMNW